MATSRKRTSKSLVLVGTFRPQNEAWIRQRKLYNLPLPRCGKLAFHEKVSTLVLFAEGCEPIAASIRFREVVDAKWLGENGYALSERPHGDRYALYELTSDIDLSQAMARPAEVFVSSSRCPSVKIDEAFYTKPYPRTGGRSMAHIFDCLKPYVANWKSATTFDPVQEDFFATLYPHVPVSSMFKREWGKGNVSIEFGNSLRLCESWDAPTVIVSDGPYGLASYPGDPVSPEGLAECYKPFLLKWYERSLPSTTLWFWNSEQGWANCHRMIEECGWEFRNCHIWNKGLSHVAGNCNTKTIRKYPVVTEVCAQYVRKNYLKSGGKSYSIRDWMREEWRRTGLPFKLTNVACGVKDAATRKYFAKDHLWYFPPSSAFVQIAAYANSHGAPLGRPYFAKADGAMFSPDEWGLMRAKFHCEIGVSNVWDLPAVRGEERIKVDGVTLHMNQKPLGLLELAIRSSSDEGDVVWEPFGGLCSAAIAAYRSGRRAFAAEINPKFYSAAKERLANEN